MNQKLIAVVGPTASGKTGLSIRLAKALGGEIISCDSMQVYKGMNIGTATPDEAERDGIPHHLMDILSPDVSFSCSDYRKMAEEAIAGVTGRGKVPIFCGGTGLYLDAVLKVSAFSPEIPDGIREELSRCSPDELWQELSAADPEAAAKTHKNNVKRVIRYLEIYKGTGRTKTEWDRLSVLQPSPYDALIIGLDYRDRSTLYDRIDRRVDKMMEAGLLDEVRALSLSRTSTAAQAIGYKELFAYLDGTVTLSDAVEQIRQSSRNYAKRQLTWFRRNPEIHWFYPDDDPEGRNEGEILSLCRRFLTAE